MTEEQIRTTIQLGCRVLLKGTLVEHTVNEFSDEHIRLVELFPRYRYSEIKTILSWPIPKELNASHVNHWVRIKTAEENPNPYDHTPEMAHMYGKWAKIKEGLGYVDVKQRIVLSEEPGYHYYYQDIAEYRPIEPEPITTRRLIDIPIGTFVRIKGKEADKWHKVVETRDNHPVIISPGGSRTMITLPLEVLETISSLYEIPDGFIIRQYNYSEWYTKEQFLGRTNLCFADIVEITPVFKSQPVSAPNKVPKELTLADVTLGSLVKFYGWDGWFKFDSKLPDETCILFQNDNEKKLPSSNPVAEVLTSVMDIPDHYLIRPMYQTEWRTKKAFLDAGFGMRMVAAIRGSDQKIPCGEIPLGEPQPCVLGYDKNKKQEDKLMLDTLDQIKEAVLSPELLEKAAQETKRIRDDKAAQQVQAKQQALLNDLDHYLQIKKNNDAEIVRVNALLAALGYPPKGK